MTESVTRHSHPRQMPGTPCWASLLVRDLGRSQEFYHELFGWEFYTGPDQPGPYVRALADGHEVAGLGEIVPGRSLSVAWLPYMACDDADATAGVIRERGGTVAVGPLEADSAGRMAIAADTAGASFGVWQPAPQPDSLSPATAEVPGAPVWYELITRDSSVAGVFYPAVFGYESEGGAGTGDAEAREGEHGKDAGAREDAADDYLTLHVGGTPVAGIHGVGRALPRDRGPYWKTYFAVADTDATARRVLELGGSIVHLPSDTPHGRVATAADPEGAQFSVTAHV
ncbi:bleomycin resistance protein [Streptomyces abyssalis]|uniref:Bleomycin resistance protein n=1 Tax=Streptomyces abyssalis TaxID=933944 RepID=A0A1E7JHU4_9ACTN|nr:VOC family protein [Streptomyces abyssalis]OEU86033.1 bleomycin resistance protein [Streptomyces abyssalis]OEU92502.1 bleomycin resistance protein [Streptomyces abyssalis]OEV28132.1 bleomycin resistance protein [Streptomyces nanshensis]